jgi:hypothetical protein
MPGGERSAMLSDASTLAVENKTHRDFKTVANASVGRT